MNRFRLLLLFAVVFAFLGASCASQVYQPPSTPIPISTASPVPRLLKPGELQLATDKDDIPAIFARDDLFVGVLEGNQEWSADELVIGLVINDDARAYPVRLLSLHEIVNDVVGERKVAVTWCPLCYSALVFDRVIDEREFTFGVSGYLYHNNLVMYDHQTNTLWSQLLAQSVRGAMRRQHLVPLPSVLVTWGEWQKSYSSTRILSAKKLGQNADTIFDPYSGYYASNSPGITGVSQPDPRLEPKELVIGIRTGAHTRAYPLDTLQQYGVINDQLGDLLLLLVYDESMQTVLVYKREVNELDLTFIRDDQSNLLRDEQTASVWDPQTGTSIEGLLTGEKLSRIVSPLVFWFAWADIYPNTELYSP